MRQLVVLILSCLLLSSCQNDYDAPCRSVFVDSTMLSTTQQAMLPYTGADTLRFISRNNDTVTVRTLGYTLYGKAFAVKNNPECPDDSVAYISRRLQMTDSLATFSSLFDQSIMDERIAVTVNNSSVFILPFSSIGVKDSLGYTDSMAFSGTMFYRVHRMTNAAGDSLYYSPASGLLRFSNAGTSWTRYQTP